MKSMLLYLWQLPQNLVGLLWFAIVDIFHSGVVYFKNIDDVYVFKTQLKLGSVSLGKYIFTTQDASEITIEHEYGHCKQSKYLGWLYLPIIGLPSIIWACIYKYTNKSYYWFYTEKSADKLSNIKR